MRPELSQLRHPERSKLLMTPVLSQLCHPERSGVRTLQAAQSKDPDTFDATQTVRTFQPQNRVPHLREAKVGSQDVQG